MQVKLLTYICGYSITSFTNPSFSQCKSSYSLFSTFSIIRTVYSVILMSLLNIIMCCGAKQYLEHTVKCRGGIPYPYRYRPGGTSRLEDTAVFKKKAVVWPPVP